MAGLPSSRRTALISSNAEAEIDLDAGCRLASLIVFGNELLVTQPIADPASISWGAFPMAPYAGRIRDGVFQFRGSQYSLPANHPPHAIHGTVFDRPWERESDNTYVTQLGPAWPFDGYVRQRILLDEASLQLELEIHTDEEVMPAACGWHPWFGREVAGVSCDIELDAEYMFRRDADGVASQDQVAPTAGPWDDCFGGLSSSPRLIWPGVVELVVESSCDYVVVYDELAEAFCVEPQTAPPNTLGDHADIVLRNRPLRASTTVKWQSS